MSYYDNQESVANIYVGLVERGWNCYGYKADESDSMTDYWSPARWDGIATKNGYVLLVDVYSTSQSGYKKTKQGFTPDYAKIEALKATINDKAASQNEKEVSQKIIDKMYTKQKESTIIVSEYPTFKNANPKGCNWHIEKDGNIIAKGKGAFQCDGYLFSQYKDETMEKVNSFIDKIESKITGTEQLEEVQKEVIKKVTKPVEVVTELNNFKKDQTIIKLNSSFTGGHYNGELLQFVNVNTYMRQGKEVTSYTFVKLGKKYQQLKMYGAANNTLTLNSNNLEKWLSDNTITTMELKEVSEVTYKTVYKKVSRKGQEENLLSGEVSEVVEEVQNNCITDNSDSLTVELIHNVEKNGIELKFNGKPSEGTRELLKENGFRWSKFNKVWFNKQSEKALLFAESFVSAFNDIIEEVAPVEVVTESITDETIQPEETTATENNPYNSEVVETPNGYNCHFKTWFLETEEIEQRLQSANIPYVEACEKYIFTGITEQQYNLVKQLSKENGSILFDDMEPTKANITADNNNDITEQQEQKEPVTTYNSNGKIALESICFPFSESSHIERNITATTFAEAEQIIHNAATHSPDNGAYDKTDFILTWSDGQQYKGRFDIQYKHTLTIKPLYNHVMSFINHVITDTEKGWYSEDQKEGYKELLDNYSFDDEKPITETPKCNGKILDFNSRFKAKQEKKETQEMTTHFIDNVLPYLNMDEVTEMKNAYESKDEKELDAVWQKLMMITAIRRAKDEILNQS